jgi:hypothetical protein
MRNGKRQGEAEVRGRDVRQDPLSWMPVASWNWRGMIVSAILPLTHMGRLTNGF